MASKILQLHKRASYEYSFIQDKYAYSLERRCYAIADGATQSFNPELWAERITKKFVENPIFEPTALIITFRDCAEEFTNQKYEFSSNPAIASLERERLKKGATSTFIGVEILNDNNLSIISCGDSNIFILRSDEIIPFPSTSLDELDEKKHFLNTVKLSENGVKEDFFVQQIVQIQHEDIMILATDALSRLILKKPGTCKKLLQINDFESLHTFCLDQWEQKQLEEDDITAIIIQNIHSDAVQEIFPPVDFSFPKEKQFEFTPSQINYANSELTDNEMQQLFQEITRLRQELSEIRKESNLQKMLLIICVALIAMLNLLFLYNFSSENEEETIRGLESQIQDNNEKIEKQNIDIQDFKAKIKSYKEKEVVMDKIQEGTTTDTIKSGVKKRNSIIKKQS